MCPVGPALVAGHATGDSCAGDGLARGFSMALPPCSECSQSDDDDDSQFGSAVGDSPMKLHTSTRWMPRQQFAVFATDK